MSYINQRIKELRLMKGYSQDDVARHLSMNRSGYNQMENDKRKISSDEVVALAEFFEVTTDDLLLEHRTWEMETLDDNHVFSNVVSGYFEVNLTKNEVIGNAIVVSNTGYHTAIAPKMKNAGRLSYDAFKCWWETNMLAVEACAFSEEFRSNELIARYYGGQKIVESVYMSRSSDEHPRSVQYTCYMSQIKSGDIYGLVVFFDMSSLAITPKESSLLSELTSTLSESFESLFYVDVQDDSYIVIDNHGSFSQLNIALDGKNFFSQSHINLIPYIQKDDYNKIAYFIDKDYLLSEFNKGAKTVISPCYRLIIRDKLVYYRMKASIRKSEPNHILIAVENVNDEVVRSMQLQAQLQRDKEIISVLSTEYSSVYCVNLMSNTFEICKISDDVSDVVEPEKVSSQTYSEAIRFCVDTLVYEEDRPKMHEATSVYYILRMLKDRRSFSTVYRSYVNGKLQYCEMKIAKIGSDEFPAEVVIGFADRSADKNNEIERELNIQRILNLSRNLEAVIEVNLLNGSYSYRMQTDISTNATADPVTYEGVYGDCSDVLFQQLISKVNQEDRLQIQPYLSVENLMKHLLDKKSFEVEYRCEQHDTVIWKKLKCVLSVQNMSPFAIIGIFDVDKEHQLEEKHLSEKKKLEHEAFWDVLTGIRNRNAYTIKLEEMNQKMAADESFEIAVAVFDVNNLKFTNDVSGHEQGDRLIKQVSELLCTVFEHSPVFRIGGDEFVVLLIGTDYSNRKALFDEICSRSKTSGGETALFAAGMSEREASDSTISEIFIRADRAMYSDKLQNKKNINP